MGYDKVGINDTQNKQQLVYNARLCMGRACLLALELGREIMETIYDFTDEMIAAHNELKKARASFASIAEAESRQQGLTERHRGRWIERVQQISLNSPLMVKTDAKVVPEPDGNETDDTSFDPKTASWNDLRKEATKQGHNVHGKTRRDIEALFKVAV